MQPDAIPERRKRRAKTLAMAALDRRHRGDPRAAGRGPRRPGAVAAPRRTRRPARATRSSRGRRPIPTPRPPAGHRTAAADPTRPPPIPTRPPPIPTRRRRRRPEPGRVDNAAGGFSYVVPAGWKVSDTTQLSYGQALLTKDSGATPATGQHARPVRPTPACCSAGST